MASPRLALCMIVKNEEAMLPACLASVRDVVDEIVLADTGSTDRTVEIARAAGARILHHPWADDFGDARNAPIRATQADWVLVLDADERLGPGAGATIRQAIRRGGFDLALLPLHNASRIDAEAEEVLSGRARLAAPTFVPRLLRRHRNLRYDGVVHESVGQWIREIDAHAVTLDAPIVHLGAVADYRAEKGKIERNVRLLEKRCATDADDHMARQYIARELVAIGRTDEAARYAEEAWDAMVRKVSIRKPGAPPVHAVEGVAGIWVEILLTRLDLDRAQQVLRTVFGWGHAHPDLHFFAGVYAQSRATSLLDPGGRTAALDEARHAFSAALQGAGKATFTEVSQGVTDWRSEERLAAVLLQLGRASDAQKAYERGAAFGKEPDRFTLGQSEASLDQGDTSGALAFARPLLTAGHPEAQLIVALVMEAAGAREESRTFGQAAIQGAARQPFATHRMARLWGLQARLSLVPALEAWGLRLPVGPHSAGPPGIVDEFLDDAAAAAAEGSQTQAVALLTLATRLDPWDARPWTQLAPLLIDLGRADMGEAAWTLALRLCSGEPAATRALATILRSHDRAEEAERLEAVSRRIWPALWPATGDTNGT